MRKLPTGWEAFINPDGAPYFVNFSVVRVIVPDMLAPPLTPLYPRIMKDRRSPLDS